MLVKSSYIGAEDGNGVRLIVELVIYASVLGHPSKWNVVAWKREQLGDEFVTSETRSQRGLMNGCGCIFSAARNKNKRYY